MGLASGETIEPATALGEVESLRLDVKAAVDVALAQNHDVQVAQINSEDAELAVKNARARRLTKPFSHSDHGGSGPIRGRR